MPYIMRNDVPYAFGGGDSSIQLTEAEYKALEASGNVLNNVTYYVTDGVIEGNSSSDIEITKLTQAEYDALSEEEQKNGMYVITDTDELSAKNLKYDDSETQLGVNNVQDAIIEQNKNFEWKFLSEAPTGDTVSLPTNFNELLVEIVGDSYGWTFNINILKSQLKSGTVRNFYNGFHNGTLYECSTASISLESIKALLSGSITSGYYKVYYR